jgi:hypothetical protein
MWLVFDLLTYKDTAMSKSYKKMLIIKRLLFSIIEYYFDLIQHRKAKKSKQLFRYVPSITAN